jgi:dTDP-4-amino-4,6-dideoxygalactose transaminase
MINVTKTYVPPLAKYQEYVQNIFESGWFTNNGTMLQKLEKRLKDYLGVEYIIPISNGTLALQIAYRLLDLKGQVITTPFSFVATSSSLVWEHLEPVFADIDPNTFNIAPENIEKLITPETTCILPVHVFGTPCDVNKIQSIANKHNLKVIYDAAHAFGVKLNQTGISNFGDVSVFSFHSTKVFHTIEGGAIIVKTKELYDKAKLIINFGIPGYDQISELGINCKMNEFQAAMGLCVLDDLSKIIKNREKVYNYYLAELLHIKSLTFQALPEGLTSNYAYFPVVFESEEALLNTSAELKKNNIFARRYFYPSLNKLPYLQKTFDTPVSENTSKRILCLPLYESLSWPDQKMIINCIKTHNQ